MTDIAYANDILRSTGAEDYELVNLDGVYELYQVSTGDFIEAFDSPADFKNWYGNMGWKLSEF